MPQRKKLVRSLVTATALSAFSLFAIPGTASAIQCVIYARQVSNFDIKGDAWTWWGQASDSGYQTGRAPKSGAAIVFRKSGGMRYGHVGIVRRVVSDREVVIDHANWTGGRVDRNISVIDVSPRNDWSQVRVWYPRINDYGNSIYPIYGFIYDRKGGGAPLVEASARRPAGDRGDMLEQVSAPAMSDRFGVSVLMRDGKRVVMGTPVVSRGDLAAAAQSDRKAGADNIRRATAEADQTKGLPALPTRRPGANSGPATIEAKAQSRGNVGMFGSLVSSLRPRPAKGAKAGPIVEAAAETASGAPALPTRRPAKIIR